MTQDKKIILSPMQKILGEDFNPGLLMIIARKSLIWCVLIVLLTMSSSLLYLRYTQPMFEVGGTLMIKQENTSTDLGIGSASNNVLDQDQLQKNIQIMRSNVILDRVIDNLPLEVSYFNLGQILVEERYKSSPFEVTPVIKNSELYDFPIFFYFKSARDYQIEYKIDKTKFTFNGKFNQKLSTPDIELTAHLAAASDFKKHPEVYLEGQYYFIVNSRANLQKDFRARIRIENFPPSIMFTMQDPVPQKASDIINTLQEEFIKYDKEKKTESSTLVLDFIKVQIDVLSAELQAYENQLKAFKIEHGLISTGSKEAEIINMLEDIRKDLADLDIDDKNLNYYLDYFTQYKDSSKLLLGVVDQKYSGLFHYVDALDRLQADKREKLLKLKPANPVVINLDKQIGEVKDNIIENINNSKRNLQQEKKILNENYDKYQKDFNEFPELEAEYERLNKLSDLKEKYYLMLLDRQASYSITLAGFVSDFVILKKADPPKTPVFPNVPLMKILGIITGIVISFVFILIRYLLSNKILSISEIDKFCNAGLIGVIPVYKKPMDVSQLVVNMNPKSVISEAFRSIRTNLDYVFSSSGSKIVTVTSTIAGEGKTFVAVNTAGIFSVGGKKTIILDFDLRKPRIHKAFSTENNKGLSTILIGKYKLDDCIKHSEWDNLDFITSGPVPPNPAEFIMSQKCADLIEELKTRYDIIVMDTPPIGVVTDAL
ncbi:MAG TPA: hypothetical protein DCQ93_05695, partial [Bacteroidetes bacterium]|nr:hypothetical protein [Bacteroidota bacterium]